MRSRFWGDEESQVGVAKGRAANTMRDVDKGWAGGDWGVDCEDDRCACCS